MVCSAAGRKGERVQKAGKIEISGKMEIFLQTVFTFY